MFQQDTLVSEKKSFLGFLFKKKDKESKGKTKEFIAKLSKGLMLPIATLPIAGLFLGIGAAIATQAGNAELYALETFGNYLKLAGDYIFGALPVLFAVAIAIAFTKDAGAAGLSAIIGFLVFSGLQAGLITPNGGGYDVLFYTNGALGSDISNGYGLPSSLFGTVLGITQLQTSVFGGFIVGFTVAGLYNKFKDIQLPSVIGFFSGVRFIPIVTFAALFPITLLVLMLWPLVGVLFNLIGQGLGSNMVGFNSFIFGFIERSLVPFGLHHAFYSPLWYSNVGGLLDLNDTAIAAGHIVTLTGSNTAVTWAELMASFGIESSTSTVAGDQSIWAFVNSNFAGREVDIWKNGVVETAKLSFNDFTTSNYADALKVYDSTAEYSSAGVNIGQYLMGKYPFMMFGLPAAAVAMVMSAPKENRKVAASIVIPAGVTALLTGITEPIEFTFLFLAPWLFWGFHASMCALSFGLMNWIGLIFPETAPHIGMTFSGGAIDWVIYGGIQITSGSSAWWSLLFGLAYAPIYYFFFLWAIKKFNIPTPGREGGIAKLFTKADYQNRGSESVGDLKVDQHAVAIINAYGGLDNIVNVDACITKLRIETVNSKLVDENKLKSELGAMGTIRPSKTSVYSVYGVKADYYKNKINDIINYLGSHPESKDDIFNSSSSTVVVNETKPTTTKKSSKKISVFAPCDGEVVDIKDVPDQTFSEKMMGDGVGFKPLKGDFSSIVKDGKISSIFPSGHALSIETEDGTQLLLHIGIDSVDIKDSPVSAFKVKAKVEDKVDLNSKLVNVDLSILSKAKSDITPIIALNETLNGRKIVVHGKGKVTKGDLLFTIE